MKIKPEHFNKLSKMINGLPEKPVLKDYKEARLSNTRFRWDFFWLANQNNKEDMRCLVKEMYEYMNDDHIDTALKKIVGI